MSGGAFTVIVTTIVLVTFVASVTVMDSTYVPIAVAVSTFSVMKSEPVVEVSIVISADEGLDIWASEYRRVPAPPARFSLSELALP